MEVLTFRTGIIGANCHVVSNGKECIIIDFGGDFDRVWEEISRKLLNPIAVLLTHGHFDHIAGAVRASKLVPIYIYSKDKPFLNDDSLNMASQLGGKQTEFFGKVQTLKTGETKIGDFTVNVIHTPGHTIGSCCFLIDNCLFSGDTLFKGGFGRYDLPTGDFMQIRKSILKLLNKLDDNVVVYPGHGANTTIGYEKQSNELYIYAKH